MKKVLALVLALALAFIMFACADTSSTGGVTNTPTPPASAPAGGTSDDGPDPADISGDLLFWMGDTPLAPALIEGFTAQYPNVNVSYEMASFDEIIQKLSLDGPAGMGPDVIAVGDSTVSAAVADGLLEPFPADLQAKVEDVILESALSTSTVGESLYGVPYSMEPVVFFYNKDLVDGPPASFEEIIEFAKTYNDPSIGKYAMRWTTDGYHNHHFLTAFGWRIMGQNWDDWKNPGFDSPEAAKGLAFYKSMRAVFDISTEAADYNATVGAFVRGEAPYLISGPWAVAGCREAGLNFGTSKMPTVNGAQPRTLTANQVVAVSSFSKNFDAAFAFAEYIASVEVANMTYSIYGAAPALKDISGIEGLAEDDMIIGMAEQAAYTDHVPTIPEVQYIWLAWAEMFAFVWDDLLSVEDSQQRAMETYETALNVGGLSMYD
ncbi:MAG: extracellular solute-binding protein [Oscillospiraceae bacterium]|nr:extracellular solute-binding protein [Oscillospiraceae bacterium]